MKDYKQEQLNWERKSIDDLMKEDNLSESLATPIVCKRGFGFDYTENQTVYCMREYDCLYKDADTQKCMNIDKRYRG